MAKDILYDMRLIPVEYLDIYLLHLFTHDLAGNSIQVAIIQEFASRATETQKKLIRKKTSTRSGGKKIPHKYQAALDFGERNDAIITENHALVTSILFQIKSAHAVELGIRGSNVHISKKPQQRPRMFKRQSEEILR